MTINRITSMVPITDLDQAVTFYSQGPGLHVVHRRDDWGHALLAGEHGFAIRMETRSGSAHVRLPLTDSPASRILSAIRCRRSCSRPPAYCRRPAHPRGGAGHGPDPSRGGPGAVRRTHHSGRKMRPTELRCEYTVDPLGIDARLGTTYPPTASESSDHSCLPGSHVPSVEEKETSRKS